MTGQGENILTEAKEILQRSADDKQIRKIYAIAKWKFGWGRKAIFGYILSTLPALGELIDEDARKHYNLTKLFAVMGKDAKSLVIKRLIEIEKVNREKEYDIRDYKI